MFILQSTSEFFWNFRNFRSIFRAFKQLLDFSGIVFALKINSKKNKPYPSVPGRARRPAPAGQAVGPCEAHLGQPLVRHGHGDAAAES
jgi:hypothetical protein